MTDRDQDLALHRLLTTGDERAPHDEYALDLAVSRSLATVSLRPLAWEYLLHIDAVASRYDRSSCDDELCAAAEALAALDPRARLGDPNTDEARVAVLALIRTLEASTMCEVKEVKELVSMVRGHDAKPLIAQLGRAMAGFARRVAETQQNNIATFSLILFDDLCHQGAVLQSYINQPTAWRAALRPAGNVPDTHLAVIPPPEMRDGVRALGATLGLTNDMPCVVFLGREFGRVEDGGFLMRQTRRQLLVGRPYPEQLTEIYRTVYDCHALFAGSTGSAIFDRLYDERVRSISPWAVWKVLAACFGGKGAANAIAVGQSFSESDSTTT